MRPLDVDGSGYSRLQLHQDMMSETLEVPESTAKRLVEAWVSGEQASGEYALEQP